MLQQIILDIEWTCDNRHFIKNEIIEIAATKLDKNLNSIDSFQTFVHPQSIRCLTPFTTNLTGITNDDIRNAPDFTEAYKKLRTFIGDKPTIILVWGNNDEQMIRRHLYQYNIDTTWYNSLEFKDIQSDYDIMSCSSHLTSVTDALINFGDDYKGKKHRAFNDVINTTKIYKYMCQYSPGLAY